MNATHAVKTLLSLIGRSRGPTPGVRPSSAARQVTLNAYLDKLRLHGAVRRLPVIHVAGSKGKGSTACMTEKILRDHGLHTGLYTSPHLVDVRERFRLNGSPVACSEFVDRFWHVWDTLGIDSWADDSDQPLPTYFCFLTLLAFDLFVEANVDVLVLETGLGGRLDATNVHPAPAATAISQLDLEHTQILGDTLAAIAREKAGIIKRGVPVVTVATQQPEAMAVLEARSKELAAPIEVESVLHFAQRVAAHIAPSLLPSLQPDNALAFLKQHVPLGMSGDFQYANAAVALRLAELFLARRADSPAPPAFSLDVALAALANVQWPARAHQHTMTSAAVRRCAAARPGAGVDGTVTMPMTIPAEAPPSPDDASSTSQGMELYIDGAHSPLSIATSLGWFNSTALPCNRALLFSASADKEVLLMLRTLLSQEWPGGVHFTPLGVCKMPADGAPDAEALLAQGLHHAGELLTAEQRSALQAAADASERKHVACASAREAEWAHSLAQVARWLMQAGVVPEQPLHVHSSIQQGLLSLATPGEDGGRPHVFVTGSLHLAGSVLHLGGWKP